VTLDQSFSLSWSCSGYCVSLLGAWPFKLSIEKSMNESWQA